MTNLFSIPNIFTIDTGAGYIYNYCNDMFPSATMTYDPYYDKI